jgi:hypothetical protein
MPAGCRPGEDYIVSRPDRERQETAGSRPILTDTSTVTMCTETEHFAGVRSLPALVVRGAELDRVDAVVTRKIMC